MQEEIYLILMIFIIIARKYRNKSQFLTLIPILNENICILHKIFQYINLIAIFLCIIFHGNE